MIECVCVCERERERQGEREREREREKRERQEVKKGSVFKKNDCKIFQHSQNMSNFNQ